MDLRLGAVQEKASTMLGDWYAMDLVLARKQYVLCVSEHARLPLILKAAPYHTLGDRLPGQLALLLKALGIPREAVTAEVDATLEYTVGKTNNRSVLGSMNQMALMLQYAADGGRFKHEDLVRQSLELSDGILLAPTPSVPCEAARELFGIPSEKLPRLQRSELSAPPSPTSKTPASEIDSTGDHAKKILPFVASRGKQPTPQALQMSVLEPIVAICRLDAKAAIPIWASDGEFFSVTRTSDELSIVCDQSRLPRDMEAERDRRLLKVEGPLPHSMTGVLSSIAAPLAMAGIPIFAVSTFDTDYLLLKNSDLEIAVAALRQSGFRVS